MTKCSICNDTGEVSQYGILDCTAPSCTAAVERKALNTIISTLPAMTPYDLQWQAYQMGKAAAQTELVDMLRTMWGHAIELAETDYFDDEQFGKAQYSQDCIDASKLLVKHKK